MSNSPTSQSREMGRMNPDVKAKWVAALRSGEYTQGEGKLNSDGRMCCYGVLCDLSGLCSWSEGEKSLEYSVGWFGMPPPSVFAWAGLTHLGASVSIDGECSELQRHNDSGRTFAQIADAIEEQL